MTFKDLLTEASDELTSSATGKEIKYFIEHVSAPNHSAYQIVENKDGTFDLYSKDDCGLEPIYKDKSAYIGSMPLVKDDSSAHDNLERTIYELFKKYINKMPPKAQEAVRDQINGNKEKHILSWYKFREYFEEI